MAVSRTTHGGFPNYASHPGNSVDVAQYVCVDTAQGVCRGRCTPDVTLSFIHYIRKLTLHHIMTYDYQITPPLTQSNQTTSNQLPQLPKLTRLLGLLSAYMHPADLFCMLSAHAKLTSTSMCPLFVCCMLFPISIPRSSPTSFFVLSYL